MGFGQNGSWTLKPMDFRIEVELILPFLIGKRWSIKKYDFLLFYAFLHLKRYFQPKICQTHIWKKLKIVKILIFEKWCQSMFYYQNFVENGFLRLKEPFSSTISHFQLIWTLGKKWWIWVKITFFMIFQCRTWWASKLQKMVQNVENARKHVL